MTEGQRLKPVAELRDAELRREADRLAHLLVYETVARATGDEERYTATLIRLTQLRIEARRRARLN
jgi:hypothetical protein